MILWKSWKSNIIRGEVTLLDFLTGCSANKTPSLLNTLKRNSSLCNKLALDKDINAINITNFKVKFFIDKEELAIEILNNVTQQKRPTFEHISDKVGID